MRLQFIAFAILALATAVVSASDVTHAHATSLEEAIQGINTNASVLNHEASMKSLITCNRDTSTIMITSNHHLI